VSETINANYETLQGANADEASDYEAIRAAMADFISSEYDQPEDIDALVSDVAPEALESLVVEAASENWRVKANCLGLGPNLFFPEIGAREHVKGAQAVCANCIVRLECLNYAVINHVRFGVWGGGASDKSRSRMHKKAHH